MLNKVLIILRFNFPFLLSMSCWIYIFWIGTYVCTYIFIHIFFILKLYALVFDIFFYSIDYCKWIAWHVGLSRVFMKSSENTLLNVCVCVCDRKPDIYFTIKFKVRHHWNVDVNRAFNIYDVIQSLCFFERD